MKYMPHEYQRRAAAWVYEHRRCGLFMEMGLGKTVVSLTAASALLLSGEVTRVLVIAPPKVAEGTWSTEAAKWRHLRWLRVRQLKGTPRQRTRKMKEEAEVHVISRDLLVWLRKECAGMLPYDMVVIDELSGFKNTSAQRFKALRALTAETPYVVGLTGTPTPNGLKDLWAQIYLLDRGKRLGPNITGYRRRWFNVIEHNHIPIKITPWQGAQEEIMAQLEDLCLGMRSEDWLALPPLIEIDDVVLLPLDVMRRYREFERESVLELESASLAVVATGAAALMGKLSQYAGGALYTDNGIGEKEEERRVQLIHEEKISRLKEIVEAAESPVLCFYQYRHEADRIEQALKGLRVCRYTGAEELEAWNAGRIDVLLAHPAATAYGLNMQQGGHTVIWFTIGWNLEQYQQANARLHRQGQQQRVVVHRLIAAGTVDERMAEALQGKQQGQSAVMAALSKIKREIKK